MAFITVQQSTDIHHYHTVKKKKTLNSAPVMPEDVVNSVGCILQQVGHLSGNVVTSSRAQEQKR